MFEIFWEWPEHLIVLWAVVGGFSFAFVWHYLIWYPSRVVRDSYTFMDEERFSE